jgi:hypothetical protein
MKKFAATAFTLVICCVQFAFAQEIAPKTQAENLLKALKPGEMELAVEKFADKSLITPQAVDDIQSQIRAFLPADRKILGFEFLGEQNIGTSTKRLSYIVKTDKQPLGWTFTFYKPSGTWLPLRLVILDDSLL